MGGILHVCTANQIRSPMAELMMIARLKRRFGPAAESLLVTSAGLSATPGVPMQPLAIAELSRRKIAAEGFTSTSLEPDMVGHAHLVLTATRRQRDEIVAIVPDALHRTFAWREMAWLLQETKPRDLPGSSLVERVINLSELARRRRGYAPSIAPHLLDVADPMGRPRSSYWRAARQIEAAVNATVGVL